MQMQVYIRFIDCTNTTMNYLNNNFLVRKFDKTLFYSLNRSLYISFDNDMQFL